MYSEEPLERQWAQVREVLLAMEEQCDDLVIDCLQGMVGELGCQVTVRRREHILTLLRELNHLYDCGIPAREMICEEDEEYCFPGFMSLISTLEMLIICCISSLTPP